MPTNNTMPANLPYWIPAYYVGDSLSKYNAAMHPAEHNIGVWFPQTADQLSSLNANRASTFTPFDASAQATVWAGLRNFENIIDVKFTPAVNSCRIPDDHKAAC